MRGNLYEAAVICPVLRATWGVAQSQLEIGDRSGTLNPLARMRSYAVTHYARVHVRSLCLAVAALSLLVAGCGGGGDGKKADPIVDALRSSGQTGDEVPAGGPPLGFPVFATKNTTRVAGGDAIADAAAIALATYPARTPESRPAAVILAEVRDWRTGIAASVLVGKPINAPILFADGDKIPDATKAALDALQPTGSKEAGGAQVIRVGTKAPVEGYKTTDIERPPTRPRWPRPWTALHAAAAGGAVERVVMVANLDRPEYAMPAAG